MARNWLLKAGASVVALAVLAGGLAAAGLFDSGTASAGDSSVIVAPDPDNDDIFDPAESEVAEGTEVTWTWEESAHTVTSVDFSTEVFDSGILLEGDEFSHTF